MIQCIWLLAGHLTKWFTHLETKAHSHVEEKDVFFVCEMRGKFIPEAAWNGLQKMDRVSS